MTRRTVDDRETQDVQARVDDTILLRVCCPRCRLGAVWTDDAVGLLATVCNRPLGCEAELCDGEMVDVTPR
jgi:hypothetical protein